MSLVPVAVTVLAFGASLVRMAGFEKRRSARRAQNRRSMIDREDEYRRDNPGMRINPVNARSLK